MSVNAYSDMSGSIGRLGAAETLQCLRTREKEESRTKLVMSMSKAVARHARNLMGINPEWGFEDLYQEGMLAVTEAVWLFKEGCCSWQTWAYRRSRWAMLDAIKNDWYREHTIKIREQQLEDAFAHVVDETKNAEDLMLFLEEASISTSPMARQAVEKIMERALAKANIKPKGIALAKLVWIDGVHHPQAAVRVGIRESHAQASLRRAAAALAKDPDMRGLARMWTQNVGAE